MRPTAASIEEREKPKMLAGGEWRATAAGDGRTAGFHLPALYSPFESWGDIAAEFLAVRRDPLRLQPWTNTKLGLPFEDRELGQFDPAKALERVEDWGDGLPEQAAVITAGVDVQGDRLAVEIVAWGLGEESWSLDYDELWGDPAKPDVWRALDHDSCAGSTIRAPAPCRSGPSASIAAAIGRNRCTGSPGSALGAMSGPSRGAEAPAFPCGPGGPQARAGGVRALHRRRGRGQGADRRALRARGRRRAAAIGRSAATSIISRCSARSGSCGPTSAASPSACGRRTRRSETKRSTAGFTPTPHCAAWSRAASASTPNRAGSPTCRCARRPRRKRSPARDCHSLEVDGSVCTASTPQNLTPG